jgi:hypothetical protein
MKLVTEQDLVSAVPVAEATPKQEPMNRVQRLLHWAYLIRESYGYIYLYHSLEYMDLNRLAAVVVSSDYQSAFSIAKNDPTFQAEGLSSEANIPDIMKFMDINQQELHEFSCDCGGEITREMMTNRIERLANRE